MVWMFATDTGPRIAVMEGLTWLPFVDGDGAGKIFVGDFEEVEGVNRLELQVGTIFLYIIFF